MKYYWLFIFITAFVYKSKAQNLDAANNNSQIANDSIKKAEFVNYLGNGYFPTKYFNFDLRYLIKFNQHEGFRTGLGGVTNETFSENFRLQGYMVYGFLDHRFKYSFGGGVKIAEKTNTWFNLFYTEDLEETGSSTFLTDKRFFQLFEPRLINIDLFHKHISKTVSIEHQLRPKILTETQFSVSKINPTYNYIFHPNDNESFTDFDLSLLKIAAQWSPFSEFNQTLNNTETKSDYPKFTLQYTKSFANIINGNFNFSKLDFRAIQQFDYKSEASTQIVLTSGITNGDAPITHLYHAYPNNVNKETILQRFSVAGINSFETMFFNEFFSDRFATFQLKHKLKPFNISPWFKPQLVLIYRYAIGNMNNIDRHENISFNTLEKGFSESGLEINKLFFGFGFSFAYRYGSYHLPEFGDNFAFKFTFNISIE
ncbi:MAG: hypothetical protein DRI75_01790 [Bacteroidetes bacterium]|nr:MAG: hypothetical protein DRI75_01790 [Bacteroidota bacterium]